MNARKILIAVAAPIVTLGITAAPAQAAPCSWFGNQPSSGICGVPNLGQSMQNAGQNLRKNFDPQTALSNLRKNLGLDKAN